MYAYVGMTHRFAPLDRSAEVLKVCLSTGRIVSRAFLPPPLYDLTAGDRPQGGGRQRGARGIVVNDGYVHVATFDSIHILDRGLRLCETVTNSFLCDVHEFALSPAGYVVSCARMDAVVWCSRDGDVERVWVATEDDAVLSCFDDLERSAHSRTGDWRRMYPSPNPTHLNSVSLREEEDALVALHNQGVLWSIREARIWHDARPLGVGKTHNHVALSEDTICLNDTLNGRLLLWHSGQLYERDLSVYGVSASRPSAICAPWAIRHGWLRGLAQLDSDTLIVGQCPAKLLLVHLPTFAVDKVYPLNEDWRASVHGIGVSPI